MSRDFAALAPVTAEWNSSLAFPDATAYPQMKRKGRIGSKPDKFLLDNTAYELTNVKDPGGQVTPVVSAGSDRQLKRSACCFCVLGAADR